MSVRGNKLVLSLLLLFLFCVRADAGHLCRPDQYFILYGGGFYNKTGDGTFSRMKVYDASGNLVGYTYGGFDVTEYYATMPRDTITAYMLDRVCYVQKAETLKVVGTFSYDESALSFADHAFAALDYATGEIRVFNVDGEVIWSHIPQMYRQNPVGERDHLTLMEGDTFYYLSASQYEGGERFVCLLKKDGSFSDSDDPGFPQELLREVLSPVGDYLLFYDKRFEPWRYEVASTDGEILMRGALASPKPWGVRGSSGFDRRFERYPQYYFLKKGETYRVFDTALNEVGEITSEKTPSVLEGGYLAGIREECLEGRICEAVMKWNGLYAAPYAREEDGIAAYLPGSGLRHFPLEKGAVPLGANSRYILAKKEYRNILYDAETGEEIWDIGDEAVLSETTLMTGRSTLVPYDLTGKRIVYDMDLNEVFSTPKPLMAIGADCYFYSNMALTGILNEQGEWILRNSYFTE